jgi:hypothetical protein
MVVRRSPCAPKSQLSSGLRAAKMGDNLSMERMKTIALLAGDHSQLFPSVREINRLGRPKRGAGSKHTLKP